MSASGSNSAPSVRLSVLKQRCFISLTIHLSILRSQRCHVDRAANPENMPNLAVNKEWASISLGIAASLSLLPDVHTQALHAAYVARRHDKQTVVLHSQWVTSCSGQN